MLKVMVTQLCTAKQKKAATQQNYPNSTETNRNTMETSNNTAKLAQHNNIGPICCVVHYWATVNLHETFFLRVYTGVEVHRNVKQ